MIRRQFLSPRTAGVGGCLALVLAGGCRNAPFAVVGREPLVRRPAQHLALTLSDLPSGFELGEELVSPAPAGVADPWGRVSAYAVTYVAGPVPAPGAGLRGRPTGLGDVVSSVNAYAGADFARAAFEAWLASVPQTYQLVSAERDGAPAAFSVYVQGASPACLIGFRAHNVIASIWVAAAPKTAAPPITAATGLARLVARRIEIVAGL
jgi:hypothetical protein